MPSNSSSERLKILADKEPEILLPLLSEYANRWRHSSNQIWSTGAVFIPLSLSGVIFGFGDPYRTLGIAIFSIILIWIWYSISLKLRSLINRNWQVYAAIESTLLKLDPPLLRQGLDDLLPRKTSKYTSIRKVRFLIPLIISIAWISTVILSFVIT